MSSASKQASRSSASPAAPVRPLRQYEVTVEGYGSARYRAASRGKAMYEAYLSDAFSHLTFGEFMKIANARAAHPATDCGCDGYTRAREQYPDATIPKPGTRIKAEGLTGVVLRPSGPTCYVHFQPDGEEREAFVHPLSVQLAEPTPTEDGPVSNGDVND